jgi:hypothetical protein
VTDEDGSVVVNEGATTEVDVFDCGPHDKGKQPIKRFPNTGINPAAVCLPRMFA